MMEPIVYAVKRIDFADNGTAAKTNLIGIYLKHSDAVKQLRHHARNEDNYTMDRLVFGDDRILFSSGTIQQKEYMIVPITVRV